MQFSRIWAMPSKDTFSIKPIYNLVEKYFQLSEWRENIYAVDPFTGNSPFKSFCVSNDLNTDISADFHLDALDFLKMISDNKADLVLYDPPYSPRQVSEVYKSLDKTVNMQTTQASYWSKQKKEISRIVKENGYCITCGWNSGGIGKKYGFEIVEILLVPHGGWHNDTIVTVERKIKSPKF